MDRILEATSMSGYGHPLRVSVFVSVVEYVDDDVIVESSALPQSISSSASADSSGRCCCCKCGWYCWRWRSKAACRRLYKYVMVCSCSLRNVWMCCCSIFITTSSRSMHSCSWCICVVGHSLDMSTDWLIDDEDTDFYGLRRIVVSIYNNKRYKILPTLSSIFTHNNRFTNC